MKTVNELEKMLDSFDPKIRRDALYELACGIESGEISVCEPKEEVNLHFHTFFSYNAYNWSPSRIAWESRKYGLKCAGVVDFDVIDAMEEFLEAGEIIGIPVVVSLETRVYISDYSHDVINSPNEPGIAYFMAGGLWKYPEEGTSAAKTLKKMRDMAKERNIAMVERVNTYLDTVRLNYSNDVLPLTPSGNATERHILAAYDKKARDVFFNNIDDLSAFWAEKLEMSITDTLQLIDDRPKLHEKMRAKLMKFGGVGYVTPTPESFPAIEEIIEMTFAMGGIPTAAYLDGSSSGEADIYKLFAYLKSKGVMAVNIIPDRNWNFFDSVKKAEKLAKLDEAVKAARALDMPIIAGTEMNKPGLPFVDDFSAKELAPYVSDFIDGAYIFHAHTLLARSANIGYTSAWADKYFKDLKEKNNFYLSVGKANGGKN